jgi:dihydroorotase
MTLEQIADVTSHRVATCFRLRDRGYIREGHAADLVLVDLDKPWTVDKASVVAQCGWSPFEGTTFRSSVTHTFVNGHPAYENGVIDESVKGQRLAFHRDR